eukprot:5728778-Pleurochrysis_carterae.AAC.3
MRGGVWQETQRKTRGKGSARDAGKTAEQKTAKMRGENRGTAESAARKTREKAAGKRRGKSRREKDARRRDGRRA